MEDGESKKEVSRKRSGLSYLWADETEINHQVKKYDSLPFLETYRGTSSALLIFSSVMSLLFNVLVLGQVYSIVDVIVLGLFAWWVSDGKKWAIIGAMIIWTAEKLYTFSAAPGPSIIYWVVYMAVLYSALRVEYASNKAKL